MDMNGIPIAYKLFRGNLTDPITYIPAIEQVKKQFGIERLVVVADKAMNSTNNLNATIKNKDGWIFSQKHRGKRPYTTKKLEKKTANPSTGKGLAVLHAFLSDKLGKDSIVHLIFTFSWFLGI
ncbi:TPA: hypothetical protein U1250_001062 [Streptococcus suis]|nr:hypothetical protein [Streptococcus suis]HEM5036537.1 hypothetical protein [Streptococcus suis]HEM5112827.1 hypothetical protein [Streptococcus suis]HEM5188740.1 hypothetical protein [Streptococcus suis]HEM5671234.1 hypothetical protein [Streptococcus suis]